MRRCSWGCGIINNDLRLDYVSQQLGLGIGEGVAANSLEVDPVEGVLTYWYRIGDSRPISYLALSAELMISWNLARRMDENIQ